jgi:hypothetical protein
MRRIFRRAAAVAATLTLAGSGAVASALPASAQPIDNEAYAASADGFISVSPVGLAESDIPFRRNVHIPGFNINQLVSSGGGAIDVATEDGASSTVARVAVRASLFAPGLQVRLVRSECDTDGDGGTTVLAATTLFGAEQVVSTFPAPDTFIDLPGVTIEFNKQDESGGVFTVTAMEVTYPGGQTVDVGVSSCEDDS